MKNKDARERLESLLGYHEELRDRMPQDSLGHLHHSLVVCSITQAMAHLEQNEVMYNRMIEANCDNTVALREICAILDEKIK